MTPSTARAQRCASRFPDCGPNKVRSEKVGMNFLGNTRNISPSFGTILRSSWWSRTAPRTPPASRSWSCLGVPDHGNLNATPGNWKWKTPFKKAVSGRAGRPATPGGGAGSRPPRSRPCSTPSEVSTGIGASAPSCYRHRLLQQGGDRLCDGRAHAQRARHRWVATAARNHSLELGQYASAEYHAALERLGLRHSLRSGPQFVATTRWRIYPPSPA